MSAAEGAASTVEVHVTSAISAAISAATGFANGLEQKIVNWVNREWEDTLSSHNVPDFYSIHMLTVCKGEYLFGNGSNITVGVGPEPDGNTHSRVNSCGHMEMNPLNLIVKYFFYIGLGFVCASTFITFLCMFELRETVASINVAFACTALCTIGLGSAICHGGAVGVFKAQSASLRRSRMLAQRSVSRRLLGRSSSGSFGRRASCSSCIL
jgi:hypothetical protein